MAEEVIQTLLAERGRRFEEDGQAIASYGRSLVFLPKGVEPDTQVRVKLQEVREDSRGRMMYRGVPSPDIIEERWQDNGTTASRVKIAINWRLEERVVEVMETQGLGTREGAAGNRFDRKLVLGPSLAQSFVEEVTTRVVPIQKQIVNNGFLDWTKTGEREELAAVANRPVARVAVQTGGMYANEWYNNRLRTAYDPAWQINVVAHYQSLDATDVSESLTTKWGDLPSWLQAELSARYPICSCCGQQRYDTQSPDGYQKCEECRKGETCVRCGKQAKVTNLEGRLVCDACLPYEQQERLIATHLTDERRQVIAAEAKKLLAGQPMAVELGFAVLKAGLGHISSEIARERILNQWNGYRWYYFTDEGVFGTKLESAALLVLQYLPQATGNSLVELVAWVTGTLETSDSDFYLRTQVKGEVGVKPVLTEDLLKQVAVKLSTEPVLANWLRGSEADRLAAVEAFSRAEIELADYEDENYEIREFLSAGRTALHGDEQNYALVLEKVGAAFAERNRQVVLADLLAQEYATCPICGVEVNWFEDSHSCNRDWQDMLRDKGQFRDIRVKVSTLGGAELVKLVAEYDGRYEEYELRLVVNHDVVIDDPEKVETKTWRPMARRSKDEAKRGTSKPFDNDGDLENPLAEALRKAGLTARGEEQEEKKEKKDLPPISPPHAPKLPANSFSINHYRTGHKPGEEIVVLSAEGEEIPPTKEEFPSNRQRRIRAKFTQTWETLPRQAVIASRSRTDGTVSLVRQPVRLTDAQVAKLKELGWRG